jgi:hypothetical protein
LAQIRSGTRRSSLQNVSGPSKSINRAGMQVHIIKNKPSREHRVPIVLFGERRSTQWLTDWELHERDIFIPSLLCQWRALEYVSQHNIIFSQNRSLFIVGTDGPRRFRCAYVFGTDRCSIVPSKYPRTKHPVQKCFAQATRNIWIPTCCLCNAIIFIILRLFCDLANNNINKHTLFAYYYIYIWCDEMKRLTNALLL